jgi:alkylation response protein AidB-like acyl-CoA dehydrogenase
MTDFNLSDEQQMLREAIAAFARDEVRAAARPADESGVIEESLVGRAWELGLIRAPIPERFGGDGTPRSAVTGAVLGEELAWGDLAIALHILSPGLVAFPILDMGTEEQQARYLPRFTAGAFAAGSSALLEPTFDFDPGVLGTTAERAGAGFVLNGSKCFVPLAAAADTMVVYAAERPEAGLDGVSAFLVDREAAGLKVGEREKNMGLKALATHEIEFKACRIENDARLGGEQGIDFRRLMSELRVGLAAMAVGVARAAFEYSRDYAKERRAFGVPIATKQAIAFMLADMAIEVDASRLLVWEAAWQLDRGTNALRESYLAKNYVAAAALRVADNAVQVLGGHGYIREHPVELWLRNARGFAALEGLATV